jgi:D-aminopeptidase
VAGEIREATARAQKNKAFSPYLLKLPITIGIEWNSTTIAETCGPIPGVKRTSS